MIRSYQAGQAKNRPPRREEGENGNLQRFPIMTWKIKGSTKPINRRQIARNNNSI
ncbi:hypothetical protein [Profundibacter sp.]|uniref:hypothetical protein n=1 Tax=Profundibacter sp. TaxID=3101071 RepID=UPI003D0A657B